MKKIFISILLLAQLNVQKAQADDALGAAAATVILIGAAYTVAGLQFDEFLKQEMESWKYDETGLTSSLSRSCNLNLELRLNRNRRQSYVIFTIHNDQDKAITVKSSDIFATYSNGAIRKFRSVGTINDVKIEPNWTVKGYYPVAEKTELADIDYINFTIPTVGADGKTSCEVKGRLDRNRNRVPDYIDYNRLLQAEFGFYYGNNLLASSSLSSSSKRKDIFGLQFAGYVYQNYGVYAALVSQDLRTQNNGAVKTAKNISGAVDLKQNDYLFGFAANFLHKRSSSLSVSAGLIDSTLVNTEDSGNEIEHKLGFFANLHINYIFYSSDYPPFRGDYMVGVGALGRFIPKYTIGSAQFGGASLAPYVTFNIGF